MPIYEFVCEKCGKKLEILTSPDLIPKLCGPRCVADDRAGDGVLRRLISAPARPRSVTRVGKVDADEAAAKGFTTYKRRRGGGYERVAGDFGPDHIDPVGGD